MPNCYWMSWHRNDGFWLTVRMMVFKLCQSARKKWRCSNGSHYIAAIIQGANFKDGEKQTKRAALNSIYQLLTKAWRRWTLPISGVMLGSVPR